MQTYSLRSELAKRFLRPLEPLPPTLERRRIVDLHLADSSVVADRHLHQRSLRKWSRQRYPRMPRRCHNIMEPATSIVDAGVTVLIVTSSLCSSPRTSYASAASLNLCIASSFPDWNQDDTSTPACDKPLQSHLARLHAGHPRPRKNLVF